MMQRVVKRAAEHARATDTRVLVSRMRQFCATRACSLELHKTPAVVDNVNTKSDRQV